MKYKKQYLNIIIFFLLSLVLYGGFLYINKKNNQENDQAWKILLEKEDIKGVSEKINDDWSLYTNKVLGIQLEYPRREFPYGMLEVRATKNLLPEERLSYFVVGFHPKDSQGIDVFMTQFKYTNLDDYIKEYIKASQIPSQPKKEYFIRKMNISGYEARLIYLKVENHDSFADENIEKDIFLIKDGVLYRIITWYLKPEESERIWDSFKFLDSE